MDCYEFDSIYMSKLPLKIKIFLWLVKRKRVLTKDNLIERGEKETVDRLFCGFLLDRYDTCIFCGEKETEDHLFYGFLKDNFFGFLLDK